MNSDLILFQILPYAAFFIAVSVSIVRYCSDRYKFTSLSSEFLESRSLFWGSVPWHYGILGVLGGHFLGFLCPKSVLIFNGTPLRLVILETTGLAFALLSLVGIILLIVRRFYFKRIKVVSRFSDYLVLFVLLIQIVSGIGIALSYRWGSNWYASSMVPYLRSLFVLNPNLGFVASMPILVKLHIVNAFVFMALIPFTRFLHFLVVPFQYLFRSWQIVKWNWDPSKARKVD